MLKSTSDKIETAFMAVGAVILILALVAGLSLLLAWPVMWLWNWLMPVIFGIVKITYWQAWGLMTLAGFLTKGSSVNTNSSK